MEPVSAGSRQQLCNYGGVARGEFLPPIDLIVISCWGRGAGPAEGRRAVRPCPLMSSSVSPAGWRRRPLLQGGVFQNCKAENPCPPSDDTKRTSEPSGNLLFLKVSHNRHLKGGRLCPKVQSVGHPPPYSSPGIKTHRWWWWRDS